MANIGQGLFVTPEMVQAAQQQGPMSRDQMQNVLRGSMFNLGGGISRGLTQAFGGDPRSAGEVRAAKLQGILKDMDFQNPQSIADTMNVLNAEGYQGEALKLLEALPTPTKPQKRIVDEWVQVSQQGGTTRRSLYQRDNLGFVHEVGAVTDTAKLATLNLGPEWDQDVQVDDDSRSTLIGQISQLPAFKSMVGDTDEGFKPLVGLIAKVANDMKEDHRAKLLKAVDEGVLSTEEANRAGAKSDDWYLQEAYHRWEAAEGIEANIKRGFNIQGADVALAPRADTTDPQTLQRMLEAGQAKAAAIQAVAERTGQLVKGNPRAGQYTVGGLNPNQAVQAFGGSLEKKSDEAIRSQLEGMGFQFTNQMYESHAKVWQLMRENPYVTSKMVDLVGNKDLYDAEGARLLNELDNANNFQQFATAARILKYLRRVGPSEQEKKTQETLQEIGSGEAGAG